MTDKPESAPQFTVAFLNSGEIVDFPSHELKLNNNITIILFRKDFAIKEG